MLRLALSTVRVRWPALVGAFVALLIGVALAAVTASLMAGALSASSAGRFSNVDAVVSANGAISLGPNAGTVDPSPRPPMSDAVVARVQAVAGVRKAVSDLAFFATAQDSSGRLLTASGVKRSLGHGWSSRELTPYTLVEGTAPRGTGQIVVEQRLDVQRRRASARDDAGRRADVPCERPRQRERRRRPRAGRTLLRGPPRAAARTPDGSPQRRRRPRRRRRRSRQPARPAASGARISVQGRGRNNASTADAGDPRAEQRDTVIAVMAMLAGNGGAVTIFVVAGIFGLMIAQRRRELALFRAVGATPRQVRRMIAAEAFVLAILAGLAGCVAGVLAAGPIASMLVERGIAPDGLRPDSGVVPMLIAFSIGLVLAESAVIAAAFRAGRVRAGEALRDASLGKERLGVVRGLLGLAIVAGGAIPLLLVGGLPFTVLVVPMAIVLAIGIALLGPLVLGLPAAALSRPLRRRRRDRAARQHVDDERPAQGQRGRRRHRARRRDRRQPDRPVGQLQGSRAARSRRAPHGRPGARVGRPRPASVARARAVRGLPGVTGAVGVIPLDVYIMNRGLENDGVPRIAAGIDVQRAGRMLDLGVRKGSIARVRGSTIAISTQLADDSHLGVGDTLRVRLPDGVEAQRARGRRVPLVGGSRRPRARSGASRGSTR